MVVVVVVVWVDFCDVLGVRGEEVRVARGEWWRGKAMRRDGVMVIGKMCERTRKVTEREVDYW